MTLEQKIIAKRLGIVAAALTVVIAILYFVYSPKEEVAGPAASKGKVYPAGQTKSIAGIYHTGIWSVDSNATGRWEGPTLDTYITLGKAGDIPVTGTWDTADGPSVGNFSNGVFTLLINGHPQVFNFGGPGDIPVTGDWNGDGRTKIGVFRKGFWLLDYNGNGKWDGQAVDKQVALGGTPGEVPIVGDWNGDGKTDLGVYRPDSTFALDGNGSLGWDKDDRLFAFGMPGDKPLVGDWNGDGRSKIGVFHNGFWTLDYNGNFKWDGLTEDRFVALGGVAGDVPVLGDWNGDGRTKVGVYRGTTWFLDSDGNGKYEKTDKIWYFGLPGDIPIAITPLHVKK